MRLEHSFEVAAPVERVWRTLVDVQRVAPCLPGAEITEVGDDRAYHGTFTVKLGPTTASYAGRLELTEVDESARRVTMAANGRDRRGQGSAKATIESSMREEGGRTRVDVVTDFTLTGRLARFGRGGMIEDVSNRLLGDFVACLRDTVEREPEPEAAAEAGGEERPAPAPAPAAAPVRAGSLLLGALRDRIARLLRRLLGRS